ncbi:CPBP family intramembrane glutamic endopeptidase [Pelagimonas varians]|uniref:CAAX amino terminal protease self- immunity n=1 Tax=Pelagimonas varians TaxID=696760 RepID=A0A238KKB0_9RHOB|nr:type II CAAX endopeptidase family protein [Pelagimonas varians]PYG29233.1 hypothetical protein C8N36_109151 [Pelagimonas varians]SMX43213.1 CAAX amino terminal protease self- immunity [Pelagimonas varians]
MFPPRYAAFERLVTQARPTAGLGRLCFGLISVAFVYILLVQGVFALAQAVMTADGYLAFVAAIERGETAFGTLAILILMGGMAAGVLVAVELVHKRSFFGLFGPLGPMLEQFRCVTRAIAGLMALFVVVTLLIDRQGVVAGMPLGTWLMFLPLTLLGLLIQVAAEELVFRGYFQSQLAARFQSPLVWLVVPSAIFALLHYHPEALGGNAWLAVGWAFAFGLAAADLTARTGTLGPALAMHLVNNFVALGLLSIQGELSGLSLWHLPYGPGDEVALRAQMPSEFLIILIYWLSARLALRV